MVLTINGEAQELEVPDIAALLQALEYEGAFFAIALNGNVVRRTAWADTPLRDGDALEILTPRQGG